jgi:peptide-methionine (S)-S-oxide reductase
MEAVFEHVKGVKDVVSGYAGGSAKDAHYDAADSGHAEAVRITYDPAQVTYARLLQVFFAVAHNPTEVNRQGRTSVPATAAPFSRRTASRRSRRARSSPG